MRGTATEADTCSLANSIVPNYLAALPSSLLPTNTSSGNIPHNCRAAQDGTLKIRWVILCTLISLPCPWMPLSMWKRKLQSPAFSLRHARNLWLHFPSCITLNTSWHFLSTWKTMVRFRGIPENRAEMRWTIAKWINSKISTEDKIHQDTYQPWATLRFEAVTWLLDSSSQLIQVFTNFPLCLCCFL